MAKQKDFKYIGRLLVINDTHCGGMLGLTPPKWNIDHFADWHKDNKKARRIIWQWFEKTIQELQPIKWCVANGDLIDGKAKDNLTNDRLKQAEMATEVLSLINAGQYFFTCGTDFHTTDRQGFEDYQELIAKPFGTTLQDSVTIKPKGQDKKFLFRHHIGGKTIDAAMKVAEGDALQLLKSNKSRLRADTYVFAHRHFASYGYKRGTLVVVTPCLQFGSRYGRLRCGFEVDIGLTYFDIYAGKNLIHIPEFVWCDDNRLDRIYQEV